MNPFDPSYYQDMSKFELAELVLQLHATRVDQVAVLLTILSAYLVVAYLVARKLSLFQLIAITLIYSVSTIVTVLGYWSLGRQATAISVMQTGTSTDPIYLTMAIMFLLAWALSIGFMIHSRRVLNDGN